VLQLASAAADQLSQPLIDTSHLLLGLAEEGSGIAAGVLESLGLSMDTIRAAVELELGEPASGWKPSGLLRWIERTRGSAPEPSLGGLQRVIAVGRARSGLALLSLELYQDGFLAVFRLVAAGAGAPFPELMVQARDGAGHIYLGLLASRGVSVLPATQQWRATYAFSALSGEARQLTFSVRLTGTNPPGILPGSVRPWTFRVNVTPRGRKQTVAG
jgi:hypothetical protein